MLLTCALCKRRCPEPAASDRGRVVCSPCLLTIGRFACEAEGRERIWKIGNDARVATLRRAIHRTQQPSPELLGRLTQRELEVVMLVVEGRHHNAIAEKLSISFRTVAVHRRNAMRKTGTSNTAELTRLVRSVTPEDWLEQRTVHLRAEQEPLDLARTAGEVLRLSRPGVRNQRVGVWFGWERRLALDEPSIALAVLFDERNLRVSVSEALEMIREASFQN